MTIHIVQEGETINSIAELYGVTASRLIQENEIRYPNHLVIGQTIVITYPEEIYIVEKGDTLTDIALKYNVSIMQLYRNNPFLVEREYIYPGDTLVISYNYEQKLSTIGYTLPFINQTILRKTLPYLTYLFIYNHRLSASGEVISFYDDTDIIRIAREYGVAPIMVVTTLTAQGTPNIQDAYDILLNVSIQDQIIDNILQIMRSKGYYGLNLTFLYLSEVNQNLYDNFTRRVSERLTREGFILYVTVDPGISTVNSEIKFAQIDYTEIGREVIGISFITYLWGSNVLPPNPVVSITNLNVFLEYVATMVPSNEITAGLQIIAYDWEIPYVAGFTKANSLTNEGAIELARNEGAMIQFDEVSQTPFFDYIIEEGTLQRQQHRVWFVDARTVNAILNLIIDNNYRGPSVWNISNYYPQLWLVINSQYDIEKII